MCNVQYAMCSMHCAEARRSPSAREETMADQACIYGGALKGLTCPMYSYKRRICRLICEAHSYQRLLNKWIKRKNTKEGEVVDWMHHTV